MSYRVFVRFSGSNYLTPIISLAHRMRLAVLPLQAVFILLLEGSGFLRLMRSRTVLGDVPGVTSQPLSHFPTRN